MTNRTRSVRCMVGQCLRKKCFREADFAQRVAQDAKEKRGAKLYVYFCPHCSGFHLTCKPQNEVV